MLQVPRGTRDFDALEIKNREKIVSTITQIFTLYGFEPIQTPSMEYTQTLLDKYGDDGEKLIYRILDSGDIFEKSQKAKSNQELKQYIAGKSLRYDQTVPLARYIFSNFHKLTFPFKRYQKQLVWRADKPQSGRFREFLQCDADVVGSSSLISEIDMLMIYHKVFSELGLTNYSILINHRLIFKALQDSLSNKKWIQDIIVLFDKISNIGREKIIQILQQKGLENQDIETCKTFLDLTHLPYQDVRENIITYFGKSKYAENVIADMDYIFSNPIITANNVNIRWDISLARGLNYYTGMIFEVIVEGSNIGSIAAGGRYDKLIVTPQKTYLPCIGISFGIDRIYEIIKHQSDLFENKCYSSQILFFNMGKEEVQQSLSLAHNIREHGISADVYAKNISLNKQFKYAEKKNIPFVCIVGTEEIKNKKANVKQLSSGEQEIVDFDQLPKYFIKKIKTS